ncbi:hypothetical protein [Butyrivibrio sp. AD3002]|uniref:hypothetical protein n=1 Tax=Butyrivibrio sp. AD3002 TaxID=1280670 RepID=UPI0012DFE345|nr:hypothetical protein [Butyrivibrio sp. AD3002]
MLDEPLSDNNFFTRNMTAFDVIFGGLIIFVSGLAGMLLICIHMVGYFLVVMLLKIKLLGIKKFRF